MSVAQRLAQLERTQTGDGGAGVVGVVRVHNLTGTGPDVVTVRPSGEWMTRLAFGTGYPLGLLIERTQFGPLPTGDATR